MTALFVGFAPRFDLLAWRQALIAGTQDCVLVLLVVISHAFAHYGLPRWRNAIARLCIPIYLALIAILSVNIVMLAATGMFFDLALVGHIGPNNIQTALPATMPMLPQAGILLCFGALATFSGSIWAARRGILSLPIVVGVVAILTVCSFVGKITMKPGPLTAVFSVNPLVHLAYRKVRPSTALLSLQGEHPLADRIGDADWAVQPGRPAQVPCCRRPDILLLTVDSVSIAQWGRQAVLDAPERYPHLAALYRRGTYFSNFYANVPLSALSQQAMMNSLHPSELFSMRADGDFPTLTGELKRQGYVSAHFMTGRLSFLQVDRFLENRGFDLIKDSSSLNCTAGESEHQRYFGHGGDRCTARSAVAWMRKRGPRPFFLWLWFSNSHLPYFSGGPPNPREDATARAHQAALAKTDEAIGEVISRLGESGLSGSTIIALVGDHGEAFGEHGLRSHATAVYEEQVHVPLLLAGPSIAPDASNAVLGSMVDLAPTLLDRAGYPSPAGWQGRSLYGRDRPNRVYFRSVYGGRTAGYREGNRKTIVSEFGSARSYDLGRDPAELRPLRMSVPARIRAEARIAAYIKASRRTWWPDRRRR